MTETNRQRTGKILLNLSFDEFVKNRFYPDFVIPAKAGIQLN